MTMSLWELWSDLNLRDAASSTEGILQSSANYLWKIKSKYCAIYYVVKWMKTVLMTVSCIVSTSLSHRVFLVSWFLYCKPTNFLLKYNEKKKTWKMFLEATIRAPKIVYWSPKQPGYSTGYSNQNTLHTTSFSWNFFLQ